jgi:hypothetical protein
MYFRNLSSLVLTVFGTIVLLVPSVSSTEQPWQGRQVVAPAFQPQVAHGGSAVPAVPPNLHFNSFVASGGAPVPPVPPPILPPGLIANGGTTVPPVPPNLHFNSLAATGGAPVPPVPYALT